MILKEFVVYFSVSELLPPQIKGEIPEITFLGKFGSKIQKCLFKVKFST